MGTRQVEQNFSWAPIPKCQTKTHKRCPGTYKDILCAAQFIQFIRPVCDRTRKVDSAKMVLGN